MNAATRLARLGVGDDVVEELRAYTAPRFDLATLPRPLVLPLADEPCVATWRGYVVEAARDGAWPALVRHLPRLRFPVRTGMADDADYRAATLRGVDPAGLATANGLVLDAPERVTLALQATAAGHVAVITAGARTDFERLVQALTARNEPVAVPASMGACMISGANNFERVAALRDAWRAAHPQADDAAWSAEFTRLKPERALYQDRFILLQEGAYSGVAADEVGLAPAAWLACSLAIRRHHECAHYLTLRLFGAMHNLLADELLADCAGLVGAVGEFRADWFLRFLGLERPGAFREGGRLSNYRGSPPLSAAAFTALQVLARRAAATLAQFVAARAPFDAAGQARLLLTVAGTPLDVYAGDDAVDELAARWAALDLLWQDDGGEMEGNIR